MTERAPARGASGCAPGSVPGGARSVAGGPRGRGHPVEDDPLIAELLADAERTGRAIDAGARALADDLPDLLRALGERLDAGEDLPHLAWGDDGVDLLPPGAAGAAEGHLRKVAGPVAAALGWRIAGVLTDEVEPDHSAAEELEDDYAEPRRRVTIPAGAEAAVWAPYANRSVAIWLAREALRAPLAARLTRLAPVLRVARLVSARPPDPSDPKSAPHQVR